MPKFKMHSFWARKMGIPSAVSNYVNKFIDFPKEFDGEFKRFCKQHYPTPLRSPIDSIWEFIGHDSGRKKPLIREAQLAYLQRKGIDYVEAYYLHHFLDYIEWWYQGEEEAPAIQEILSEKKIEQKIGSLEDENLQRVKDFVLNHLEAILWRFDHPKM